MAAPKVFGAGLLAGCGVLLVQQVRHEAQEQQNIREMTEHLMAVKQAYARAMAAMSRAVQKKEQQLLSMRAAGEPQQTDPALGAHA